MKKHRIRKSLIAIFMMIVLGITGCSSSSDTPSAPDTSSASDSSAASEAAGTNTENAETATPDPITMDIFMDFTWMPVDSFEGIIPEEITRQTGVTLDATFALDYNQLGVMASSGELPDLVWTQNMIDRLSSGDICYSIEDLIEEYDIDWDITPQQLGIGRGLSNDGKAYTILNHVSTKEDWVGKSSAPMVGTILLRKDLMDAIGNPESGVNDLDSFYDMLAAVHEAYPDMTTLVLDEYWNISVFRYLTGMGGTDFIEQEDGSYTHYIKDSRWEDIMLMLNKCYRSGFLNTDAAYFVPGNQVITADMYVFSTNSTQNGITSANADLKKVVPDGVFHEMMPWDSANYLVSDFGWAGLFIPKTTKDPKAAIELMAWMFTPEAQTLTQMGREGYEYTIGEDGQVTFSDEWLQAMDDGTHNTKYNPYFYFGGSETVEADSRCSGHDPAWTAEPYKIMRERYDNYPWIQAALPIGDTDEKMIWDTYRELLDTYQHRIILAGSEEEAISLINEFRDNAEKVGLSKLEEYMTNKIAEIMPLYS
ncbi:MAG: extracellular solute-binding protein [Lachnospiraceae bacterium]|nr:extracellular solute-binding protein [Lachnospiraceae bacterium]